MGAARKADRSRSRNAARRPSASVRGIADRIARIVAEPGRARIAACSHPFALKQRLEAAGKSSPGLFDLVEREVATSEFTSTHKPVPGNAGSVAGSGGHVWRMKCSRSSEGRRLPIGCGIGGSGPLSACPANLFYARVLPDDADCGGNPPLRARIGPRFAYAIRGTGGTRDTVKALSAAVIDGLRLRAGGKRTTTCQPPVGRCRAGAVEPGKQARPQCLAKRRLSGKEIGHRSLADVGGRCPGSGSGCGRPRGKPGDKSDAPSTAARPASSKARSTGHSSAAPREPPSLDHRRVKWFMHVAPPSSLRGAGIAEAGKGVIDR